MTNWIPDQVRNDEVLGFSPGVDSPSPGEVRESWVSASLQPSLRPYVQYDIYQYLGLFYCEQ
jgi:hypothetical protein